MITFLIFAGGREKKMNSVLPPPSTPAHACCGQTGTKRDKRNLPLLEMEFSRCKLFPGPTRVSRRLGMSNFSLAVPERPGARAFLSLSRDGKWLLDRCLSPKHQRSTPAPLRISAENQQRLSRKQAFSQNI